MRARILRDAGQNDLEREVRGIAIGVERHVKMRRESNEENGRNC
jgi:hypothetical protein